MFDIGYSLTCRDAALPVGKLYKLRDACWRARRGWPRCAPKRGHLRGAARGHGRRPRPGRGHRLQAQGRRRRLPRLPAARGKLFYSAEGLAGYDSALQLGAAQPHRRRAGQGRRVDRHHRARRSGRLRPGPGRHARPDAGAGRGLSPQQCRQLCRSGRILRRGQQRRRCTAEQRRRRSPTRRCRNRTSAATPKPTRCSPAPATAVGDRPDRRPPAAQLSRDASAQPGPAPRPRWTSSTSRCPGAREIAGHGRVRASSRSTCTAERLNADSKLGPAARRSIGRAAAGGESRNPRRPGAAAARHRRCACTATPRRPAKRSAVPTPSSQAVRGGKVVSIVLDARADPRRPRRDRRRCRQCRRGRAAVTATASTLLEASYPGSAALLNAKARLAGYLARTGQTAAAEAMFREIVQSQPDTSNLPPSFAIVLRPYVDLLLKKERSGRDRRNFRRDPADGPSRPRPDPGGPRARAERRHRRSRRGCSASRSP